MIPLYFVFCQVVDRLQIICILKTPVTKDMCVNVMRAYFPLVT